MKTGRVFHICVVGILIFPAGQSAQADPSPEPGVGCTVNWGGGKVDGATMWTDIPDPENPAACSFHRFAFNNFLHLVGDKDGHPRFMSMASSDELFPAKGAPSWPGGYTRLETTRIVKSNTVKLDEVEAGQAGDDFDLVDVGNRAAAYDIRVNKSFFDYVAEHGLYTWAALGKAATDFSNDAPDGGVWLPSGSDTEVGALEIKTAWRAYGTKAGVCPEQIMHCEQDDKGNWYGFVGMHLVQKTPTRGELIWASFEHVANAPDCQAGGSNPIQQFPADPTRPGKTLNVNRGIESLREQTGWSFFNYLTYSAAGGDGLSCNYPDDAAAPADTQQCNSDPSDGTGGYRKVDVCRTDQLPPADASCIKNGSNGQMVSCLNRSVQEHFPNGLDAKWRYYMLIGSLWMKANSVPTVGCFEYAPGGPSCPKPKSATDYPIDKIPYPATYPRTGTMHLANTTMETWLQKGMAGQYGANAKTYKAIDCFTCHEPVTTSWGEGDTSHIFTKIKQKGN